MDRRFDVLVIADTPALARELASALERRAQVLGPVEDARDAADVRPDVIVVDLDRDDGQGLAALERAHDVAPGVRLLASTTDREPGTLAVVLASGASGILPPDHDPAATVEALERALAGELVMPDAHLSSLVEHLHVLRWERTDGARLASLTPREIEVLALLGDGLATVEVAQRLGIGVATVQSHVKNVLSKLGVHSKVEAVRIAWRGGAIGMPASA